MSYNRILTIQDISCLGQCSLTVALPILSACGLETCVLPSAILSTHTGGFSGYTFRDLTDDIPNIQKHWEQEGIKFDAFYTGYLGSKKQVEYVKNIFDKTAKENSIKIVDPAMADNGRLYAGFDDDFVGAMKALCDTANIIIPNITEACLLTGTPYKETYDESYIDNILNLLANNDNKTIILTGVSYDKSTTGVVIYKNKTKTYYSHKRISKNCHGTGDIFASAFSGALVRGKNEYDAAKIAADYTLACIEETISDENHWYGVKFEPVLIKLIEALK